MALATRCPHCQTTFRVAHDQLKLRAGLVRCGACKEIFNGVEHLLRPEEMQQALSSAKTGASSPQATSTAALPQTPEASALPQGPVINEAASALASNAPLNAARMPDSHASHESHASDLDSAVPENTPLKPDTVAEQDAQTGQVTRPLPPEEIDSGLDSNDPLQRMTLMDFTGFDAHNSGDEFAGDDRVVAFADGSEKAAAQGGSTSDAGDELSQAIKDLQNKPWRQEKARKKNFASKDGANKTGKPEPNFMAHARRQKRYGKAMRITMGAGSALLCIALLLQGVFVFRNLIAAKLPEYRPVLTNLCLQVGCRVELPAQIDKVSIESSELQSLPSAPSRFTLAALLRNQSATDQAWPYLELTLNDTNEKPVARKVFQPGDYLVSPQAALAGFPPQSEQPVRISFEMLQLKASGYRLYLFYP